MTAGSGLGGRPGRRLDPFSDHAGTRRRRAEQAPGRAGLTAALLLALPMFGQVFHYLIDIGPLYALSKAWPMLCLPLTVYGLWRLHLPAAPLFVALLAYVVGVTPLISMIELGNGLVDAIATTVKVLPFSYYFAVAALLALARATPADLRRATLALGWATFAAMIVLWTVVPVDWYVNDPAASRIFLVDEGRGYRIYMPMIFGILLLFYCARRGAMTGALWPWLVVLGGLIAMVAIFKQRTPIAATVLMLGWILVSSARGRRRTLLLGLGAVAATLALAALVLALAGHLTDSFGASLSVRQVTVAQAWSYLAGDPLRLLLGVGSITRFSQVTFADIFGNAMFYLADIGWVGVLFEYGLVGSLLIAATYAVSLRLTFAAAVRDDPFSWALADYALFLIVCSLVYSVVYTPGEIVMVAALAVHQRRCRAAEQPEEA